MGANSVRTIHAAPGTRSWWDRLFFLQALVGFLLLGMLSGLLPTAYNPIAWLWNNNMTTAAQKLAQPRSQEVRDQESAVWIPVKFSSSDNLLATTANSPGFTSYGFGNRGEVALVDSRGQQVHRWRIPLSEIVATAGNPLPSTIRDTPIQLRKTHVFGNGDLLALFESPALRPAGSALCRVDQGGRLIWSLDQSGQRDFAVDPNGKVFALTRKLTTGGQTASMETNRLNLDDYLTVVSSEGQLEKEISLWQLFLRSPFFRSTPVKPGVPSRLQTTSVSLIGPGFASHHPAIKPGFLMVCFQELNLVAVIDPEAEEIVWAIDGPWQRPQFPQPLDNGNVMLVDCLPSENASGRLRILEFDSTNSRIVWQSGGPLGQQLPSHSLTTFQPLPGGNILICDAGSRILEMTRQQLLVWQWVHPPRRAHAHRSLVPAMSSVRRYPRNALPFLDTKARISIAANH